MGADPRADGSDWLDDLSPTAVHIVGVARRLLVEKGFEAITIEAVAL